MPAFFAWGDAIGFAGLSGFPSLTLRLMAKGRREEEREPRCSCSCVVLLQTAQPERERETDRERRENLYGFFCLFFGVQVQRPLVWVWGVQPQPLARVEPLSLPALTKPTTGALVSMRTHPNPPICPHFPSTSILSFQPHRSSTRSCHY